MSEKKRLDSLLMEKFGYSREFSKEIIKKGVVVDGKTCNKAGEKFFAPQEIVFDPPKSLYVSRGGYKLEKAINFFNIDLENKVCVDVGASTGGFTDCMLTFGAQKVYAIDGGKNQLVHSLKNDTRVISHEETNIKFVTSDLLSEKADFLCADLSFISLTKVLQPIVGLLAEKAEGILLIKPQFEAGQKHLNKKGIVKDLKVHARVIEDIYKFSLEGGLYPLGITISPISGGDGNIEYLMHFSNYIEPCEFSKFMSLVKSVVEDGVV